MRKFFIAINLILLTSVWNFAQSNERMREPESTESNRTVVRQRMAADQNASENSDDPEKDVLLESGTSLDAKLISSLDVKKTKVGDEVVLKTTESIRQNGEVIVPKGTKLIGRITEVQQKTKENKTSKLSMVFERLQNKSLAAPINATIVSIASARGNAQAGDLFGTDTTGSSRTSGRVSGGNSSAGGLLGGATGTVGGALNTATSTVGGVTNTVGNTAGGATRTLGRTINGIQISQTASASAEGSSTLSAENKNIRLQKGTQFRLQLNESVQN
jgi:hypothetical protein